MEDRKTNVDESARCNSSWIDAASWIENSNFIPLILELQRQRNTLYAWRDELTWKSDQISYYTISLPSRVESAFLKSWHIPNSDLGFERKCSSRVEVCDGYSQVDSVCLHRHSLLLEAKWVVRYQWKDPSTSRSHRSSEFKCGGNRYDGIIGAWFVTLTKNENIFQFPDCFNYFNQVPRVEACNSLYMAVVGLEMCSVYHESDHCAFEGFFTTRTLLCFWPKSPKFIQLAVSLWE